MNGSPGKWAKKDYMGKRRWKHQNYKRIPFTKHDKAKLESESESNCDGNVRRQERKRIKEIFGGKCILCGYCKTLNALEFHHLDSKTKISSVSRAVKVLGYEAALSEAMKCILVCANCHRELEEGVTELPKGIRRRQRKIVGQQLANPRDLSSIDDLPYEGTSYNLDDKRQIA